MKVLKDKFLNILAVILFSTILLTPQPQIKVKYDKAPLSQRSRFCTQAQLDSGIPGEEKWWPWVRKRVVCLTTKLAKGETENDRLCACFIRENTRKMTIKHPELEFILCQKLPKRYIISAWR